jgi:hypothetical protein
MKPEKKLVIRNCTAEFLIFTRQAGEAGIEVRVAEETVWLAQKRMATLFDVDIRTISEHLGRLFKERELQEVAVIRKFRTTAADGKGVISEHPCRRANGPTQPQPRATPWVSPRWFPGALKGRPKRRQFGRPFRAPSMHAHCPRALPWALLGRAFGPLSSRLHNCRGSTTTRC